MVHCSLHWILSILVLRPSLRFCMSSCNQVKSSTNFCTRRGKELNPPDCVGVGLGV